MREDSLNLDPRIEFSVFLEMLQMTLDRDHSPPSNNRQEGTMRSVKKTNNNNPLIFEF